MIFIRPLYKYDIEKLYEMKTNPLIFDKKIFNIDFSTVTKESINDWFYNFINEINTVRLGICLCESNTLIGSSTLGNVNYNTQTCELHMYIDNIYHGNGYGYNALKIIIDYCKNILKLKEIYLNVHTENLVAIKLYKKVNFEIISVNNNYIHMKLNLLDY